MLDFQVGGVMTHVCLCLNEMTAAVEKRRQ